MGVLKFDRVDDRLKWTTLASALANVSDGAWTCAALCKRAATGTVYHTLSYLNSGTVDGSAEAGFAFESGNKLSIDADGVSAVNSLTTLTDTTNPYLLVVSKGAGTVAPRLGFKLGSAGSWTHENFVGTLADQIAATMLYIGSWKTLDLFNGWIGVIAWWEGAMSDANKEALDDNWRTSDLWNSAHGQPKFLTELNTATPSDLASNASSLTVTGSPVVDSAETLNGWTFDGVGSAPTASAFLDGKLDELAIYNVVLSDATQTAHYNAGTAAAVFHLEQRNFRGRNDDGDEAGATWKAGESVNWPQVRDQNVRVRYEVQEVGGLTGATTAQHQYRKNGGAWTNITAASTNVRASASPNVTDGAATTDQLTSGSGTFGAGSFDEVDGAFPSVSLSANGHTEFEDCVQIRSADVAIGDTIELRLTFGGDATPLYTQTPSIVVVGALPTVDQKTFRGRNDDGNETTATWKATQGTDWTQRVNQVARARFQIQETGGGGGAVALQLRASRNGGAYFDVTATSSIVRAAPSAFVTDDQALTEQLTGGTGSYAIGRLDETDGLAAGDPLVANGHTEVEFSLFIVGADVTDADTIQLRLAAPGQVVSFSYTDTPILTVQKPAAIVVTTTTLPNAVVAAPYSTALVASGGLTPVAWSVVSGTLPPGLTLNPSTGVISGTPTTIGVSAFTVRASDAGVVPETDDQALTLTVATYQPTVWVNDSPPALDQTNLDKIESELDSQATAVGVAYTPTDWRNNASPALTEAAPLNNIEAGLAAVATALGLSYTRTAWGANWTPPRDALRFNKIEAQLVANRNAIP